MHFLPLPLSAHSPFLFSVRKDNERSTGRAAERNLQGGSFNLEPRPDCKPVLFPIGRRKEAVERPESEDE